MSKAMGAGMAGLMAGGAWALSAGAALAAAAPVAAETRLHIEAMGEVPPDTALYTVTLQAAGPTPEAAQQALSAQQAGLAAELGRVGVAAGDIAFAPAPERAGPGTMTVMLHTASADEALRRMAQVEAEARAKSAKNGAKPAQLIDSANASGVLSVTLRDLARQDQVASVLGGGQGFALTQAVRLYAGDSAKAHRAAVAQALAKARAEGDAYAAALGWRIARIAGVSNAKPGLSAADLIGTLARVDGAGRAGRAEVLAGTSYAAVAIDFVIAP